VADQLPASVEATRPHAGQIMWLCDPVYSNTCRTAGSENTHDNVTEFIDHPDDLRWTEPLPRSEPACDPRLDPKRTELMLDAGLTLLQG
jgi:3-deoxy-D-arabino-heptulosonate 7-phosphate (DAHP) synthase class II